jgi:hypothetical protein
MAREFTRYIHARMGRKLLLAGMTLLLFWLGELRKTFLSFLGLPNQSVAEKLILGKRSHYFYCFYYYIRNNVEVHVPCVVLMGSHINSGLERIFFECETTTTTTTTTTQEKPRLTRI